MERTLDPIPYNDPPIQGGTDPISKAWGRYFEQRDERLAASASVVTHLGGTAFANLAASLPPTDLGITQAGIYQVSWTLRITQAAMTSSSLTVAVAYLDSGVGVAPTGPAVVNGTVTTVQSGTFTIRTDAASPVTISTTYLSVGATPMRYTLDVVSSRVA